MSRVMTQRSQTVTRVVTQLSILLLLVLGSADSALAKKKKKKSETRAQVTGVVTDTDGKTLRDVQVVLSHGGETVGETTTSKKGAFELEVEEAGGTYSVTFRGDGYSEFTGEVELEPGSRQDLNVKLLNEAEGQKSKAVAAYNSAAEAHRKQDLDAALTDFQRAIELDPSLSQAYLGIADVYLQQGKVDDAVVAAEKFLAANPDDEQGKKVAFEAYRRSGQLDKAKEVAGDVDAAAMTEDLAIGVYNEGAVASQNGDYETALAKFQEAAELNPEMAQAHAGAASILYNQQKYGDSLAAAEKALAKEPQNRQGLRIKYLSLDAEGKVPEALAVWDAYKEIDADGAVDILYRRAEMDFQSGDSARAQEALKRVLALRPDFARGHYTLGLTYTATDPELAKKHLQQFIELAPDDPEVPAAKEILAYF